MPRTKSKSVKETSTTDKKEVETESAENKKTPLQTLLGTTDVLLMLYPKDKIRGYYSSNIESIDERTVYSLIKSKQDFKENLIILLDTGGGNVYAAVKIMDCLRTKYKKITIAVPQEAKSSGTMMCLGADELIMTPISELGPLDKPLPHPQNDNEYISALDIVKSIDDTLDIAAIRVIDLASDIRSETGLRIKTSFELANEHIGKLISPMLSHEDIKSYNQAKRLLAIAESYAKEFLNNYMLKFIKNEKLRDRITSRVIRQFVWLYPDHAFAIRRNELSDWFFNISKSEELDYWDELWKEFESNLGSSTKKIQFLSI